ncbi:MAG TPA: HIT domain-containing protein [Synergistaceae bacterium]|nr:HIT domain-containing protein [Synergistaceae bacterium]HQF91694.1 HIT domain-containing protein [Synergistaceae bacterium]HQH78920.1 HIT domain-containing protein [Synergistaceae bacterium]HQK24982.1 HIT domain-containing protein [Synergistaceae bacterium]
MSHLFAPWRMAYIGTGGSSECIFCAIPAASAEDDGRNLLIHRGDRCFVVMNRFPYNPGHLMVAPYRHVGAYDELTEEELLELNHLTQRSLRVLRGLMNPQGFNLGVNLGKGAGAGFDGHVHMHVVPRWDGDTNFMPVLGDVRVIPEALDATCRRLGDAWSKSAG